MPVYIQSLRQFFRHFLYLSILLSLFSLSLELRGQQASMEELEDLLVELSGKILVPDSMSLKVSLEEKLAANKVFARELSRALTQPESYQYPFDRLKSISIQTAVDQQFRIFTWIIRDRKLKGYDYEDYHYHFGLVQRKYIENGVTEYIVIPLIEVQKLPKDAESLILDQNQWVGALYYPQNFQKGIPSFELKYVDPRLGPKAKPVKQKFYLLLGWNGYDHTSNLKLMDVMTFDPKAKDQIIFGANVFYYESLVPKTRVIHRYSENAPFSMNFAYVKNGPFNLFRKKMLVFDHLRTQKNGVNPLRNSFDMGPDGTYDAFNFYKGAGVFEFRRGILLAEKYNRKVSVRQIEGVAKEERKRLSAEGISLPKSE